MSPSLAASMPACVSAPAVRVCMSLEEPTSAPRGARRAAALSAVRAKHRRSFEYKGKLRYDGTECVTSAVVAGQLAAPQCTAEIELEVCGAVSVDSVLLKIADLVEMLDGARPASYERLADTAA